LWLQEVSQGCLTKRQAEQTIIWTSLYRVVSSKPPNKNDIHRKANLTQATMSIWLQSFVCRKEEPVTAVDQEVLLAALVVVVVAVVVVHDLHHEKKVTTHILKEKSAIRQGHEKNRGL